MQPKYDERDKEQQQQKNSDIFMLYFIWVSLSNCIFLALKTNKNIASFSFVRFHYASSTSFLEFYL